MREQFDIKIAKGYIMNMNNLTISLFSSVFCHYPLGRFSSSEVASMNFFLKCFNFRTAKETNNLFIMKPP